MGRVPTIVWENGVVRLIDQRKLPQTVEIVECCRWQDIASAIREMKIRGAPAIGAAAAYGVALGAAALKDSDTETFRKGLREVIEVLAATRPTAVNLFWALDRMKKTAERTLELGSRTEEVVKVLVDEAHRIAEEDVATCKRIGEFGVELIPDGAGIYTHCNTGALATVDYGTALGVIRSAHARGKQVRVYAGETRPFLQGARLTAWELKSDGIPVTLVTDNMAGHLMKRGLIDLVILGADRIAANGDTANKIGTYSLAVLAKEHEIPFYVAAPLTTVDMGIESGDEIPIEERHPEEVTHVFGVRVAPEGIDVLNPAFDVTPAQYISAIITDAGVIRPPYEANLKKFFR